MFSIRGWKWRRKLQGRGRTTSSLVRNCGSCRTRTPSIARSAGRTASPPWATGGSCHAGAKNHTGIQVFRVVSVSPCSAKWCTRSGSTGYGSRREERRALIRAKRAGDGIIVFPFFLQAILALHFGCYLGFDLGTDTNPNESTKLCDPAAAHEPGENVHVCISMLGCRYQVPVLLGLLR